MLDYPSLAAVDAVIREGSFERAAASLAITPSAVSQRVRGLEERLGAIVIVRGQPCRPTQLGQRLCAHFDRVRLLEHDLAPVLGQAGSEQPVSLRVAVNADSLATWFADATAAFSEVSGVSLHLTVTDENRTSEKLLSGEVLAAVTSDATPVQGCKTSRLGALRYRACASPPYMTRYRHALTTSPYLRFDRDDHLQHQWARRAWDRDPAGTPHYVPSTQGFVDFAIRGIGWGMQPEHLVADHLASGRLLDLDPALPLDVDLYWTAARLPSEPLRRLSTAVHKAAGGKLLR